MRYSALVGWLEEDYSRKEAATSISTSLVNERLRILFLTYIAGMQESSVRTAHVLISGQGI
jgi:hypothetical protein